MCCSAGAPSFVDSIRRLISAISVNRMSKLQISPKRSSFALSVAIGIYSSVNCGVLSLVLLPIRTHKDK